MKHGLNIELAGSGWVITEQGKRIDWPMLATEAEARAELAEFHKELGQLEADEASERNTVGRIAGEIR